MTRPLLRAMAAHVDLSRWICEVMESPETVKEIVLRPFTSVGGPTTRTSPRSARASTESDAPSVTGRDPWRSAPKA